MHYVSRCPDCRKQKRQSRLVAGVSRLSSLVVVIFIGFVVVVTCQGQSTTTTTTTTTQAAQENLETLSDEELESICTTRGFELIREENGIPFEFTHEDYVEAAQRCLDVEREMNEVLAENPQLAMEVDEEVKRMLAEKTRLEKEQAEMKAEKEELEGLLRGATEKETGGSETNNTQVPRAFGVGGSKIGADKKGNDTTEDLGVMDLDSTDDLANVTKEAVKDDVPATTTTSPGSSASNQTKSDHVDTPASRPSAGVAPTPTEVLTVKEVLREIFGEVFQKVEDDVKRVITLMLPVLKTMSTASNTAVKYLRLMLNYAQSTLSEYQQKSNKDAAQEKTDSKEQKTTATNASQ